MLGIEATINGEQVWGVLKELISASILIPIVWFLLRKDSKTQANIVQSRKDFDKAQEKMSKNTAEGFNKLAKAFQDGFKELAGEIKAGREEYHTAIREQTNELRHVIGSTVLDTNQSIDVIRDKVWYYSDMKLKFIKQVLEKNNIQARKSIISRNIKAELQRLTKIYVNELNEYQSSKGKLGDWVANNFDMKEFLDELFIVVFRESEEESDTKLEIEMKINDIGFIMKQYQNAMIDKMNKNNKK